MTSPIQQRYFHHGPVAGRTVHTRRVGAALTNAVSLFNVSRPHAAAQIFPLVVQWAVGQLLQILAEVFFRSLVEPTWVRSAGGTDFEVLAFEFLGHLDFVFVLRLRLDSARRRRFRDSLVLRLEEFLGFQKLGGFRAFLLRRGTFRLPHLLE